MQCGRPDDKITAAAADREALKETRSLSAYRLSTTRMRERGGGSLYMKRMEHRTRMDDIRAEDRRLTH